MTVLHPSVELTVIFLTPDIRCMESEELTSVYGFLFNSLQAMAALHHVAF